jgi:hypothetical protein
MGAYFRASVVALLLTSAVIWWGWPERPLGALVHLSASSAWTSATLDDGLRLTVLQPGDQLELPPGTYSLTLAGDAGLVAVPLVVLTADVEVDLGDLGDLASP